MMRRRRVVRTTVRGRGRAVVVGWMMGRVIVIRRVVMVRHGEISCLKLRLYKFQFFQSD